MLGRFLLSFALLLSACSAWGFDNLDYGNPGETNQVVEWDRYSLVVLSLRTDSPLEHGGGRASRPLPAASIPNSSKLQALSSKL